MLDPIQNHALRLCLGVGAYRTSPSSSLCVLANEPPLHLRRQKLSIQYSLRLSSTSQNPAWQHTVQSLTQNLNLHFNANHIKFRLWEFEFTLTCRLLALEEKTLYSVLSYQHRLGFSTHLPDISFSLHSLHKDDTAPEIFRHNFNELCADYKRCTRLYTDGSTMGDGVASAVVWQKSCKTVRLPSNASIFRAELYAISLALNIIRHCRDKDFIIFSDSMSSLQALSGFKLK